MAMLGLDMPNILLLVKVGVKEDVRVSHDRATQSKKFYSILDRTGTYY